MLSCVLKENDIHKISVLRGYEKLESAGNTQGAAETRGWDTKNKYSTQTKKKNMKK